jgi:hypothetical protein
VTGDVSDLRLREAFRTLADTSQSEVSEELRERIWLAVSGELPAAERRELVDRMATDAACAEAWRVANELWQALQAQAEAVAPARAPGWKSPWLAAAAALVVSTAVGVVWLLNKPSGDEFRASPDYVVESLVPADVSLPRNAFRLRWTPGPRGSRYELRVMTADLQLLAMPGDLSTAEVVLDQAVLSNVPGGASILWQVDVVLPTGQRMTSTTFTTPVE